MATQQSSKRTITIDDATGACLVQGIDGRLRRCTATALGMALLSRASGAGEDGAGPSTAGIEWIDHLQSHGLAIGRRGQDKLILGTIPAKVRAVRHETGIHPSYTLSFPEMLATAIFRGDVLQRGQLYIVQQDPTKRRELYVGSPTPCLAVFTYGNVYSDTGYICWGHVGTSSIRTLRDVEETFFSTPFNGDLVRQGWASGNAVQILASPAEYTWTVERAVQSLLRQ